MPSNGTARIRELGRALKKWRRSHKSPTPIPQEIWSQAAHLTAQHGVGPVARELGLDHSKLKRLSQSLTPEATAMTFIELRPTCTPPGPEQAGAMTCLVEVESMSGPRMRANLAGCSAFDLATLFKEFSR